MSLSPHSQAATEPGDTLGSVRWSHRTGIIAMALAGLVLAAAVTYLASTLVSQPIGLTSEPARLDQSLAPTGWKPATVTAPAAPTRTPTRTVTTTVTTPRPAAPAPAAPSAQPPAVSTQRAPSPPAAVKPPVVQTTTKPTGKADDDDHGALPGAPRAHDGDD